MFTEQGSKVKPLIFSYTMLENSQINEQILPPEHRKISKICLTIFQDYA